MCSLTSFFVGGKCLLNQTTYSVSYFVYMQYVSIHLSIYLFYVSIHLYDVMGLFVEWLVVRLATQVAVQRWKKIKDTYYWQEGAEVMVECETLALVHHLIIMFLGLPPPTLFPPSLLPSPLFPSPPSFLPPPSFPSPSSPPLLPPHLVLLPSLIVSLPSLIPHHALQTGYTSVAIPTSGWTNSNRTLFLASNSVSHVTYLCVVHAQNYCS